MFPERERARVRGADAAATPDSMGLVASLAAALLAVVAACWWLARARRRGTPAAEPVAPSRGVTLSDGALWFHDGSGGRPTELAPLLEPFGVTLLANRARTRVALVVTTASRAVYVAAAAPHGCLLLRALPRLHTVASDERALIAAAPDGGALTLRIDELVALAAELIARDPGAPSRVFSVDARGDAVALSGDALTVGASRFDLTQPLRWRATLFRERGFGGVDAVYQATYVEQGGHEVALVSLLPALSSPLAGGDLPMGGAHAERAVREDIALLDHSPSRPPATERRVAIDRVFVLPIRHALARAPRARRATARRQRDSLSNLTVERAPEIVRDDGPVRRERRAEALHPRRRRQPARAKDPRRALSDAEVSGRPHVEAPQVEDQEHLRRPDADAAHLDQRVDDGSVVEVVELVEPQRAVDDALTEIAHAERLAERQPRRAQRLDRRREHLLGAGRPAAVQREEPPVDRRRGLAGQLLVHDGADERREVRGAAADAELVPPHPIDQRRHPRVGRADVRERAARQRHALARVHRSTASSAASIVATRRSVTRGPAASSPSAAARSAHAKRPS